jgi:streptogramin lyase
MIFLRSIFFVLLFTCYLFSCPAVSLSQGNYEFVDAWGSLGSGNGQFDLPGEIAVGSSGYVYVNDGTRIQKFSSTGDYITQWSSCCTMAVDSLGYVYVADYYNNNVQKFSSTGTYILQWGSTGGGNGQFANPQGIAVDSSGNVYVADGGNSRIQKFSSTGSYITQWGSYGSGNGQFMDPWGVAVDSLGNVYVAENGNSRIQKFSSTGIYITQWGSPGSGNGQFTYLYRIAVDSARYVYVTDTNNNRIQKFSPDGTYITQWGEWGLGNGQLANPQGIAVDSSGYVYVADYNNNRVQKFAPPCGYPLLPAAYAYSPQSSTGMFTVTPSSGSCNRTATSNDPWIHVMSGSSGIGNGTVSYSVDANPTGIARKGTIAIGGPLGCEVFTVRQASSIFADDPQDASTPYIYAMSAAGITHGCDNPEYYCPSDQVTRSAMAVFIIRALYGDSFDYTPTPYFTDVPPDYGAFSYIQKFRDANITQVIGTYDINGVVTRGEMAVFIVRALYGDNFDYTLTPYFTDVPPTYGAFTYIQKFRDANITQVTGTYNVDQPVTRDQMAVFLARTFLGMQ